MWSSTVIKGVFKFHHYVLSHSAQWYKCMFSKMTAPFPTLLDTHVATLHFASEWQILKAVKLPSHDGSQPSVHLRTDEAICHAAILASRSSVFWLLIILISDILKTRLIFYHLQIIKYLSNKMYPQLQDLTGQTLPYAHRGHYFLILPAGVHWVPHFRKKWKNSNNMI